MTPKHIYTHVFVFVFVFVFSCFVWTYFVGISNGVALKCILAKVNLHYPKEKVEDMEEDHKGMMDKPQDTANLEGIVDFLEQTANRSPKSSAMLNRFERALENKSLFDLTDQEAVALEPGLLNFPDSHQP